MSVALPLKISVVPAEAAPLDLLLLADPSVEHIARYLSRSIVFVGEERGTVIAVAVLVVSGAIAELHNIAVAEHRQGVGVGNCLLRHVLKYAAKKGVLRVNVGTGNSSFRELAFYQRNGFRVVGVIEGFFDDYLPPIVENGIVCRDMIRLRCDLDAKVTSMPVSRRR